MAPLEPDARMPARRRDPKQLRLCKKGTITARGRRGFDEPELQPRPEPSGPALLAHGAKEPPREAPCDECHRDLKGESDEERRRVRVSEAPLVEGSVLAAVQASVGATIDQVVAAAESATSMPKLPRP